jgi:hypothetical protein
VNRRRAPEWRATFACHDRNAQSAGGVAHVMREPRPARQLPVVRLAQDDFDGAYDDRPAKAAAAA